MELGLSLGDPSKSNGFLPKDREITPTTSTTKSIGLCMALGIKSSRGREGEVEEKEEDREKRPNLDEAALMKSSTSRNMSSTTTSSVGGHHQRVSAEPPPPLQLDLFSLAPLPSWPSDNGSSERGSSENTALPPARGFDVNRLSTAEEGAATAVSSPNSVASSFQAEYFSVLASRVGGHKRDSDTAAGNDAVAAEGEKGSDDDENGSRKKLRLSKEQSVYLEESFKEHNTLNPKQKQALAKQLNLRPRQVEVWFQNRRARTKLKQTEVDCEYLKRCCETLTDENRRLHKELQELRALKSTSSPFYMQLPATTLTMCPSCERVATSTSTTTTPTTATEPASKPPCPTPFPLSRPTRVLPFFQTLSHPHKSAAS